MDDDRIIAEHSEHRGAGRAPGESMDVLLQLSLPIVLILALLVNTQVTSLRDHLGEQAIRWAERYAWAHIANEILDVYEMVRTEFVPAHLGKTAVEGRQPTHA